MKAVMASPSLSRSFSRFLLRLAFLTSEMEHRADTFFYCREILKLDPELHEARYLLALEKYRANKLESALADFQELEEKTEELFPCVWHCGEILWRLSREEEALPYLRKSLKLDDYASAATALILQILQELQQDEALLEFASEQIAQGKKLVPLYRARAMAYWKKDENEKAISDLNQALRIDPNSADAWGELAVIFYSLMKYPEAMHAADTTLQLQPEQPRMKFLKAVCLHALGRLAESREILDPLLNESPEVTDFQLLRAQIASAEGDFQTAKEFYGKILAIDPQNPTAQSGIADAYLHLEEWENAVELLTSAIAQKPDSVHFYFQRCLAALAAQKFEMAMEDVNFLIEKKPERSETYVIRGRIRFAMKQPEAAIVDFQKAAALDPANFLAFQHLAEAKCSLGLHEAALSDLDTALEHSPKNTELLFQKIAILMPQHRAEEAVEAVDRILEWSPNDLKALFQRGAAKLNLRRFEEALADFDRVLQEDPVSNDPHFARALALNGLFRHEEALAEFDKVLENQPNAASVLAEKAMTYLLLNKKFKAKETMDKVLRLEPENIRILNLRGGVFASMGKIAQALRDFRRAVQIQPEYVPALNNLGHILAELGDLEKGLEYLDSAIQFAPEWARPYLNRAQALCRLRKFSEAEEAVKQALRQARNSGDEDSVVDALELRKNIEELQTESERELEENSGENELRESEENADSWKEEESSFEDPSENEEWMDLENILKAMEFDGMDEESADEDAEADSPSDPDAKNNEDLDTEEEISEIGDTDAEDEELEEFSENDRHLIREFWQQMRRAIQRQKWQNFKGNQEFETDFHSDSDLNGNFQTKKEAKRSEDRAECTSSKSETETNAQNGAPAETETGRSDIFSDFPEFRSVPKIQFWNDEILSFPFPEKENDEPVTIRWNYFNFDKKSLSELKEELRQQDELAKERIRLRDSEEAAALGAELDEDWIENWDEDLSEDFDQAEEEKRNDLSPEETERLYEILNQLLRFMERDRNRPLRCQESDYWALETPETETNTDGHQNDWYVEKNFTAPIIINCADLLEILEQEYPVERKMSRMLRETAVSNTDPSQKPLPRHAQQENGTELENAGTTPSKSWIYEPKLAFLRLREAPKTLFEILTRISEFLDEELQRSRSVLAREEVLGRKNQLCSLMDLVMKNVINGSPRESMIVFTNFLTPAVLTAIMRSRSENDGEEIDYDELIQKANFDLSEMWDGQNIELEELEFFEEDEWESEEDEWESEEDEWESEEDEWESEEDEWESEEDEWESEEDEWESEEEFEDEWNTDDEDEFEDGFDDGSSREPDFGRFFNGKDFPEEDEDDDDENEKRDERS